VVSAFTDDLLQRQSYAPAAVFVGALERFERFYRSNTAGEITTDVAN
jgi:hypothetical protein